MTQYGPASAHLTVGGRILSGDHYNLDVSSESVVEEVHGLGDSWEESLPVGLGRVTLDASGGLYDDRTNGINEAFVSMGSTRQIVCFGFSGTAAGADVEMADGTFAATYKRISSRDGLTKANAVHKITGVLNRGRIIAPPVAITAASSQSTPAIDSNDTKNLPTKAITNASVANPTVVTCAAHGYTSGDVVMIAGTTTTPTIAGQQTVTVIGADTFTVPVNVSSGGAQTGTAKKLNAATASADLHVSAITLGGYTSCTLKVRHSVDDSTYADLCTFTAVTSAPFAERQACASVRRYRAFSWLWNGTGSGQSITPLIVLSHA